MKYIRYSLIFLAFTVGYMFVSGALNLYPSCALTWSLTAPLASVSIFVFIATGLSAILSAAAFPPDSDSDLEIAKWIWKAFAALLPLCISLAAWENYLPDADVCAEEYAAVYGVPVETFREGSGD